MLKTWWFFLQCFWASFTRYCSSQAEVILILSWVCVHLWLMPPWWLHKLKTTANGIQLFLSLPIITRLLYISLSITSSFPEKFPSGHCQAFQNRSVNVAAHHPKPAGRQSSQCLSTYFTDFAPWLDVALNKRVVAHQDFSWHCACVQPSDDRAYYLLM